MDVQKIVQQSIDREARHRLDSGLAADILAVNPKFFQDIGLNVGLSPTRSNGFASLVKQIYLYARVFAALTKK